VGLGWETTGNAATAGRLADALAVADADVVGELAFALARLAADRGIDAEEALRRSAQRFRARFAAAERLALADGTTLAATSPGARQAYWEATGGT